MAHKPKFKSDAFEAVHSAASGLYKAGGIDKATMREFDESCPPLATGLTNRPNSLYIIMFGCFLSRKGPVVS